MKAIEQCTQDQTSETLSAQRVLRDAVRWNFCVIGEALSQLEKRDHATAERITDYRKIIGLRNQLIHGYGTIDDIITWRIVTVHLPVLRRELDQLLAG